MGDSSCQSHLYISRNEPIAGLPPWVINHSVSKIIHTKYDMSPTEGFVCGYHGKVDYTAKCLEFVHSNLAFGNRGLVVLKLTLSKARTPTLIEQTLRTLCNVIHDPEKAVEALRLNILFQLRRLLSHTDAQVIDKTAEVLKILAGQPGGGKRIIDDDALMQQIIQLTKHANESNKKKSYELIHVMSMQCFTVPQLLSYGLVKIILDELMTIDEEAEEHPRRSYETEEHVTKKLEVILLETLENLISFNEDAILGAICNDVYELKKFTRCSDRDVRILTWLIFRTIFTSEIGRMAVIPHKLINASIEQLRNNQDEDEIREITGMLMVALIKVENRVEFLKTGFADVIVDLVREPSLKSNTRLFAVNILSHFGELPSFRDKYAKQLSHLSLRVRTENQVLSRHLNTLVEKMLWVP